MTRPGVAWAGALVVVVILARTGLAIPMAPAPERRDPAGALPWMADALPDVGPQRREEVARILRTGAWSSLAHRTRATAQEVFVCPIP